MFFSNSYFQLIQYYTKCFKPLFSTDYDGFELLFGSLIRIPANDQIGDLFDLSEPFNICLHFCTLKVIEEQGYIAWSFKSSLSIDELKSERVQRYKFKIGQEYKILNGNSAKEHQFL